jgi:hypothetical protein
MGGIPSLSDINDQLYPDTLTLGEWRRAREPASSEDDNNGTTSDDLRGRSNEHPTGAS